MTDFYCPITPVRQSYNFLFRKLATSQFDDAAVKDSTPSSNYKSILVQ